MKRILLAGVMLALMANEAGAVSTYSPRLRFEQQAAGDNLNTWGPKINAALLRLEEGIGGRTAVSTYPITLTTANGTSDQARAMFLDCSGAGGTITIPAAEKVYVLRNSSSGTITITTGSGATTTVAAGESNIVMSDGTNVYKAGGSYLPLGGGTLTGGLTGTSYTFTGNGSVGGTFYPGNTAQNIASDSTTLYLRGTTVVFQDAAASTTRASLSSSSLFSTGQFSASLAPGSTGQFAAVNGASVAMLRNDGASYYLLGNPASTTVYDAFRPFTVNLTTGAVAIDNGSSKGGTTIGGNALVGGTLGVSGATTLSSTLGVTGAATLNSTLGVTGATTLSGGVSSTTGTFSGALSGASVTGSMVANAATTLSGASSTTVVTPAGFAGSSSITANGYYKFPGGLIQQWGVVTLVGTSIAVTWPTACPSNVFSVQVTPVTGSASATGISAATTTGTTIWGTAGFSVYYHVICN